MLIRTHVTKVWMLALLQARNYFFGTFHGTKISKHISSSTSMKLWSYFLLERSRDFRLNNLNCYENLHSNLLWNNGAISILDTQFFTAICWYDIWLENARSFLEVISKIWRFGRLGKWHFLKMRLSGGLIENVNLAFT